MLFERIRMWIISNHVKKKKYREYKSFFSDPSSINDFGRAYNFYSVYSINIESNYVRYPNDEKILAIKDSLELYIGNPQAKINNYLRIGNPEFEFERSTLDEHIKNLDLFLSQIQLKEPVFVIRKVKSAHLTLSNKTKWIKEVAYLSTSLNLDYNLDFNSDKETSKNFTYLVIRVPKGAHASYLESKKNNREEYELLLPRNSIIKIDKQYKFLSNRLIFGELQL